MKRRREGNSNRKCNLLWQNKLKSKGPKRSNRNGWPPPPRRRPHIWSMAPLDKGKTAPLFSPCILQLKVKRCLWWGRDGREYCWSFWWVLLQRYFFCLDSLAHDVLGEMIDIYLWFWWYHLSNGLKPATIRWFNSWPDLIPKRWRSRLQSLKRVIFNHPTKDFGWNFILAILLTFLGWWKRVPVEWLLVTNPTFGDQVRSGIESHGLRKSSDPFAGCGTWAQATATAGVDRGWGRYTFFMVGPGCRWF